MIDHNHPAVEAALDAEDRTDGPMCRDTAYYILECTLPLLTADDLRNTLAGKQLLAEGWDRGVADNERGWDHVYSGHDVDPDDPLAECQTCETPNPYRTETPGDAPEG